MSAQTVISIIGRPNVGKSSLFNRIIGKRVAVVDDMPGVTRDRNYYTTEWNGEVLTFVDTGGMLPTDHSAIPEAIHEQVRIAMAESAAIILLVDATTGVTDVDLQIAMLLRKKCPDKVLCVVNKCESEQRSFERDEFRALGLGTVYPVSATHGNGVADMLDRILEIAHEQRGKGEKAGAAAEPPALRIAIIGRPNAGKSSLVNMLLHKKRMIVDDQPGTTRDAIDSEMVYEGRKVIIIDTAGLRKKSHVKHGMEYYANLRALGSIERCDICVLLIDVNEKLGIQDLRILKQITEMRKGVLLAWNKWDVMPKDHKTFDQLVAESRREFRELQYIPMVSISALTGQRATNIIDLAFSIYERMKLRIPGAEFEDTFFSWVRVHPHPAIPEDPVRFLGARQVDGPSPQFKIFVSNHKEISPAYHRFLLNKIYETYGFEGCPVVIEYRPAKKPKKRPIHATGDEATFESTE